MTNIYIDYDIILKSDVANLKKEFEMLIASGKLIIVWHKTISPEEMAYKLKELDMYDYVWSYKVKDSMHYSSVDFIIDSDEKLVNRFANQGIPGNIIEKL